MDSGAISTAAETAGGGAHHRSISFAQHANLAPTDAGRRWAYTGQMRGPVIQCLT